VGVGTAAKPFEWQLTAFIFAGVPLEYPRREKVRGGRAGPTLIGDNSPGHRGGGPRKREAVCHHTFQATAVVIKWREE